MQICKNGKIKGIFAAVCLYMKRITKSFHETSKDVLISRNYQLLHFTFLSFKKGLLIIKAENATQPKNGAEAEANSQRNVFDKEFVDFKNSRLMFVIFLNFLKARDFLLIPPKFSRKRVAIFH